MDVPLAGRDRFRRRRLSEDRHQAGTAPNADRTPAPVKWVNAFYDSIHGKIVSKWKHEDGRFQLEVTIPPNTTALVMIPAASASKVTESGRAIGPTGDVKFLRQEGDRAVFETQSGTYRFLAGR